MNWFYAYQGQQVGPVSETELNRLAATGTITPETLVWHDGLPAWKLWGELRPPDAAPPVLTADGRRCGECGRAFVADDLITLSGVSVCAECKPRLLQRLQEGALASGQASGGLWREGKVLVLQRGAQLPPRCVRCNQPATWQRPVKLWWNPPWIYLTILLSLIVLLIVALVTRKMADVTVPLCEVHRQRRTMGRLIGWLTVVAGLVCSVLGFALIGSASSAIAAVAAIGGILVLLIGFVIGSRATWVLMPKRIDADYVRLRGCCEAYLQPLPPFKPGPG